MKLAAIFVLSFAAGASASPMMDAPHSSQGQTVHFEQSANMGELFGYGLQLDDTILAQGTIGPHDGPICPGPGPQYHRQTPACGAKALGYGTGIFQRFYQSTGSGCTPVEVFIGCAGY